MLIHWNPVKHGWARKAADWPYSSFHAHVRRGSYPNDWGGGVTVNIDGWE
jgi:putative transposase